MQSGIKRETLSAGDNTRGPIILRRIAAYLKAQNWNAIAIEFVIVTAGVLMGIQVSNWNESRLEKVRLEQQSSSLRTELVGNLAAIRDYQGHVKSQLADLLELEASFGRPGQSEADVDRQLMNVFRVRSLILETSAYEELSDSGGFRYLAPDIRSAMTEWQASKGLLQRVDQDALAFRMSVVDHLFGTLAFGPMVETLDPSFKSAADTPLRNDLGRLGKDPKVRGYLAMRYGIESQKLEFSERLARSTEKLIALFE